MRLIDADALMETIRENSYPLTGRYGSIESGMFVAGIQQAVDEASTIEPPVVHGRWVHKAGKSACSHCGAFAKWDNAGGWWEMAETACCPSCGCDMRGDTVGQE